MGNWLVISIYKKSRQSPRFEDLVQHLVVSNSCLSNSEYRPDLIQSDFRLFISLQHFLLNETFETASVWSFVPCLSTAQCHILRQLFDSLKRNHFLIKSFSLMWQSQHVVHNSTHWLYLLWLLIRYFVARLPFYPHGWQLWSICCTLCPEKVLLCSAFQAHPLAVLQTIDNFRWCFVSMHFDSPFDLPTKYW